MREEPKIRFERGILNFEKDLNCYEDVIKKGKLKYDLTEYFAKQVKEVVESHYKTLDALIKHHIINPIEKKYFSLEDANKRGVELKCYQQGHGNCRYVAENNGKVITDAICVKYDEFQWNYISVVENLKRKEK